MPYPKEESALRSLWSDLILTLWSKLLSLSPWLPASVSEFCVHLWHKILGGFGGSQFGWVFSVCKSEFSFSDVHVTIWSLNLWWCVGRSKHWKERRSKFFLHIYCVFTGLKWLWNTQMRLPLWQFLLRKHPVCAVGVHFMMINTCLDKDSPTTTTPAYFLTLKGFCA